MTRTWTGLGLAVFASAVVTLGVPAGADSPDPQNGKTAYTVNCLVCHGEMGDGKGPAGVALNPPPRDFSKGEFNFDTDGDGQAGTDTDLTAVVKQGAMAFGGSALMTPWMHLPEKDIQDIVAYIRTLQKSTPATAASAAQGPSSAQ